MNRENDLKDILDYIDNGITSNNHNDRYILYICLIHNFILNTIGVDFKLRYDILKQANLKLTKLVKVDNDELRDEWIKFRNLIITALIENNEDIDDNDRYYI